MLTHIFCIVLLNSTVYKLNQQFFLLLLLLLLSYVIIVRSVSILVCSFNHYTFHRIHPFLFLFFFVCIFIDWVIFFPESFINYLQFPFGLAPKKGEKKSFYRVKVVYVKRECVK